MRQRFADEIWRLRRARGTDRGTPSFVIGNTGKSEIAGVRIVGALPFAVFDSTIKDLLADK